MLVGVIFFALLALSKHSIAKQYAPSQSQSQEREIDLPPEMLPLPKNLARSKTLAGVYGNISSVGSDTLANLISLWAEAFKTEYPHVKFQLQASGSATAPQALTQGTATIGPMSRALTANEISQFTRRYGYPPTTIIVAVDAIAIYVEKNNPIERLSLQQVDALFSSTRFCGSSIRINKWRDLAVSKFGDAREVLLYGRNSASGTYDLFKQQALCDGDYKARVNELPGSASVVLSIASSVGGLGYAAMGYVDENVKALSVGVPMKGQDGSVELEYIAPTLANITSGKYPFSRYLYIVVNKEPGKALPVLERAFLRFILSEKGQEMVADNKYYPINQELRVKQLSLIEAP
ncbi:phosphate ABC transporter substrate-binding protein [Glaciecola sp. MH2013]|nr:phosphate ABC transporter substrate-binding protein [Glaciecola sp. MH2013]